MPDRSWSIDSIAHALPHPVTRQKFLSQVNLTPVAELQAVIDRWIAFVERWEAEKPRIDAIARYARDHGGELPPDFDDDGSGEEWLTQWRSRMRGRNSDAA